MPGSTCECVSATNSLRQPRTAFTTVFSAARVAHQTVMVPSAQAWRQTVDDGAFSKSAPATAAGQTPASIGAIPHRDSRSHAVAEAQLVDGEFGLAAACFTALLAISAAIGQ